MKYKTKSEVVEATQWFKNGDHPLDAAQTIDANVPEVKTEGRLVRSYRMPFGKSEDETCKLCKVEIKNHGWVDIRDTGKLICPGDWIITLPSGDLLPCKPDIFKKRFELADGK